MALPAVLARIYRALRPGGLHFASYKAGGVPGRDRFGGYFSSPDRAQLRDAYVRGGAWEVPTIVDHVGGGYEGGEGPWIAITACRPGPG